MPTNCRPFPPYSDCALMNSGISSRHGAHHVAQKLTTITLPRHCASGCSLPEASGSERPASAAPACGEGAGARCCRPKYVPAPSASTAARPITIQRTMALLTSIEPVLLARYGFDDGTRPFADRGDGERDFL